MSTITHDSPSSNGRIKIIDALRGFTLLGIIITHMVEQYYAGPPPEKYAGLTTPTIIDTIASAFCWIVINGKFYAIFSFLFGLSFHIQLSKTNSGFPFLLKFSWRLTTLFAIGFIHHLHYRGDILTIYALLGFVLLISYRLSDKYLLVLSAVLVFDIPGICTRVIGLTAGSQTINDFLVNQDQTKLLAYYEIFKSGTYLDFINANLESFGLKMGFQVWSGRIYMTPGLFLLGLYAGRKKIFANIPSATRAIKEYVRKAGWGLLATVLSALAFFTLGNSITGGLSNNANILAGITFYNFFNTFLAVLFVCWFILLFQKEKWKNRLMYFYNVGRMGLTTYLMQAFFGVLIYSTLGLELLGELGAATSFVLAAGIFGFQMWVAKLWLKRFRYGPVEWLWRCLTAFKIQPLVKGEVNPTMAVS